MLYYSKIQRNYLLNGDRIKITFTRPAPSIAEVDRIYDAVCNYIKESGIEEYLEYIESISEIVIMQYCSGYQMTISLKQKERDPPEYVKYTIDALTNVLPNHINIAKYISIRTIYKFVIKIE